MKIKHTVTIEIDEARVNHMTQKEIREYVKQEIDNMVGAMQNEDWNLGHLYE